jgi:Fic family protein
MIWNWQKPEWPHFTYNTKRFLSLEDQFLQKSGILLGVFKHFKDSEKKQLTIELLGEEALKTSAIEGEFLNRSSIQSSLQRHFGLKSDGKKIPLKEQGIAELMLDLYESYEEPLSDEKLFAWHKSLLKGRRDIKDIGKYRTHKEPMQVVSSLFHDVKVHFEAPPSSQMKKEMKRFVNWFNESSPSGKKPLPTLTRASLSHLYFVCIHPFEDGNGRIGRALSEKILAQSLKYPTLTSLAYTIEKNKKAYYLELEHANKTNKVDRWIQYFSSTMLEAQAYTLKRFEFVLSKTKFYEKHATQFNERQKKVIERMFREGPESFIGGLSADKYLSITKTTRATATRDLKDLVDCGALIRKGELRYTRYFLNL